MVLSALLTMSDHSSKQSFLFLPRLTHHPHSKRMDNELIILSGVIVLVVLLFVSANKWQKAEKKLEKYKEANSPDSSS